MGTHELSFAAPRAAMSPRDFARLAWLDRHLPGAWTATRRRRRILFLAMAAPGFLAVFGTTYHHNFFVMLAGFALFGAAVAFRAVSEPLFVKAASDDLFPAPHPSNQKDSPHA
jgi:hypothetical protein